MRDDIIFEEHKDHLINLLFSSEENYKLAFAKQPNFCKNYLKANFKEIVTHQYLKEWKLKQEKKEKV